MCVVCQVGDCVCFFLQERGLGGSLKLADLLFPVSHKRGRQFQTEDSKGDLLKQCSLTSGLFPSGLIQEVWLSNLQGMFWLVEYYKSIHISMYALSLTLLTNVNFIIMQLCTETYQHCSDMCSDASYLKICYRI